MNILTVKFKGIACIGVLLLALSVLAVAQSVGAQNKACEQYDPLSFDINADIAGSYNVWSRVNIRDSAAPDDNTPCVESNLGNDKNEWVWVKSPDKLSLKKNQQVINAYVSASEVWIDKMIFTLDDECDPEGLGEACMASRIDATLSGIEPGSIVGDRLDIFADISGLGGAANVSFILDGEVVSENNKVSSGLYCMGNIESGACGAWDSSGLSEGEHSVVLVVKDSGRSLSLSRKFTVAGKAIEEVITPVVDTSQQQEPKQVESQPEEKEVALNQEKDEKQEDTKANKAVVDKKSSPSAGGNPEKKIPTVVIDTTEAYVPSLEGEVRITVPSRAITSPSDTIVFTLDGEEIAETTAESPEIILDTTELDNKRHEIGATVLNSSGSATTVEVPILVNNSPFEDFKKAITSAVARVVVVVLLLGTALVITVVRIKKHILLRQIQTARIINPQPLPESDSITFQPGMAAAAMVVTLVGLSGVVIASPSLYESSAYLDNSSIVVELEDAKTNNRYTVNSDRSVDFVKVIIK